MSDNQSGNENDTEDRIKELPISISRIGEVSSYGDKMLINIPWGHMYLSLEPKGETAFRIFSDLVRKRCYDCDRDDSFVCESIACAECTLPCPCRTCKKGRPGGLIVSRRNPARIRKEFNLQTTPIVWLTSIPGNYNLNPEKTGIIEKLVNDFIDRTKRSVVLIEGLEYLININGFSQILRMLEDINDMVMIHESIVIVTVDERILDSRELAYLQRNTTSLQKIVEEQVNLENSE